MFPNFPISTQDSNLSFELDEDYVVITWKSQKRSARIPLEKWELIIEYVVDVNTAKEKYKAIQKANGS